MTARSSLTLYSRLGPISEPSKDSSLSENTLLIVPKFHAPEQILQDGKMMNAGCD